MKGTQTMMIAIGDDHLINADLVKTATMERRGPTTGTVVLTMHDGTEHRIAYPPVEVGGIDGRKVIDALRSQEK